MTPADNLALAAAASMVTSVGVVGAEQDGMAFCCYGLGTVGFRCALWGIDERDEVRDRWGRSVAPHQPQEIDATTIDAEGQGFGVRTLMLCISLQTLIPSLFFLANVQHGARRL